MSIKKIIENLKNPRFNNKVYYILFLPLSLLSFSGKERIKEYAHKNWGKSPALMHRLYWSVTN